MAMLLRAARLRWAAAAASGAAGALACARCAADASKPPPAADAAKETPAAAPAAASAQSGGIASLLSPVLGAKDYVVGTVYDNLIKPYAEPSREKLLPDHPSHLKGREQPTLILDLDGCLIESTWTRQYGWRYVKRPGVDKFLASLAPHYELVLWTDAMNAAEPVLDKLDPHRLIRHRLYRDTTTFSGGHHRKDLSAINRDLKKVLIIDTKRESFSLHPDKGILIKKYVSDDDPLKEDNELMKLVPFLQYLAIMKVRGLGCLDAIAT